MAVLTPLASDRAGEVTHDRPPSPSMLRSGLSSVALSALGLLLGFVSVPVLVAGLGYAGYGVYSLAFTIAGYGAFLDLGLGWAGMKFAADAHARRDRNTVASVLWALALYQLLIGGVVAVGLWAGAARVGGWLLASGGDEAARVAEILPTAGLWFALSSLAGVLVGILRGVDRAGTAALAAGCALVIGVGGAALAVGHGYGLPAAAGCQVLGALVALLVAAAALRAFLLPVPGGRLVAASADQLRRMLGFSLWSLLGRLVQVAVLQGDKVIAARVAGAAGLAAYVVPFNLAQRLNALGAAAVTAVYPVAAGRAGTPDEFRESYLRAARVVHLLTAAPALTLIALAPLFLHSWIGPEMAATASGFLRVLGLGYWIVSVSSVEAGCLEGWGHPRLTALAGAGSVGVAALVAGLLLPAAGGLWAVAGGVAAWMTATGLATTIAWQRVCRIPTARLWRELLQPIVEMAGIALVAAALVGGWVAPGPAGLLACVALGALLLVYGFLRLFRAAERRMLLTRMTGLAGR